MHHRASVTPENSNMSSSSPHATPTCCKEKAVLVAVYVETPRRRRLSSKNNHQHQHHHHYLHQPHGANGGGYNRRADLLDYSRHLRASARSGPSTPLHSKPVVSESNNQPTTQVIGVGSKTEGSKRAKIPTCLGNMNIVIPSFLRSLTTQQAKKKKKKMKKRTGESTATKMKSIMKIFQVQKKGGFLSKLFASLQKHR